MDKITLFSYSLRFEKTKAAASAKATTAYLACIEEDKNAMSISALPGRSMRGIINGSDFPLTIYVYG
jgi:hypothetical protein